MTHHNDPRDDFPFGPRQWRRFEAMARRGFRQGVHGMRSFNFGDWDGMGDNFKVGRMLASGDLRLVALYLIEQQPRHGYDLIKAIEEKTAGFYVPSPGIVYPALTFLEEAGYVTSSEDGNKKLYTITDEGRTHLNENRAAVEATLDYLGRMGARWADWSEKMADVRDRVVREVREGFSGGPGAGPDAGPRREGAEMHFGFRGGERGESGGPFGRPGPGPERADRDMADVVPDLNEARKALKAAIRKVRGEDEVTQRKAADILRRAADEIGALGQDDIDL